MSCENCILNKGKVTEEETNLYRGTSTIVPEKEGDTNGSITETARANNLNVYYYIDHLLTKLLEKMDDDGNISDTELEEIMPWSKTLPADCYSKRRG